MPCHILCAATEKSRSLGHEPMEFFLRREMTRVNFGQGNLRKNAFQESALWAGNLIHHEFSELAYNLGPSWKLPVLTKTSSALLGTCAVARLCLGLSLVTAYRRPALHLLISAPSVQSAKVLACEFILCTSSVS